MYVCMYIQYVQNVSTSSQSYNALYTKTMNENVHPLSV